MMMNNFDNTIKLLQDLTKEIKADNDRAETLERARKIDAEIKARKMTRNDPSDSDWAAYYRDVHGIGGY
jgi:GTPase